MLSQSDIITWSTFHYKTKRDKTLAAACLDSEIKQRIDVLDANNETYHQIACVLGIIKYAVLNKTHNETTNDLAVTFGILARQSRGGSISHFSRWLKSYSFNDFYSNTIALLDVMKKYQLTCNIITFYDYFIAKSIELSNNASYTEKQQFEIIAKTNYNQGFAL